MAEQRLPIVDGDDGEWGDVLNQYISKEHYQNPTLTADDPANGGHETVTIRPGTISADTAPLKFTSGSLMTAPEAGAIEFLDDKLYFTQTTDTVRRVIASYDDSAGVEGDIYYRDNLGDLKSLAAGSNGEFLRIVNDLPVWDTFPPTGNPGEIQFNDEGAWGHSANFTYDKQNDRVVIGENATILPDNPLAMAGDVNSYLQMNIQNKNVGEDASADYIVTADNGDDSQNYADLGICNSGYANTAWDVVGPDDTYVFGDGGNVTIGTLTPGKKIPFFIANTIHEAHPADIVGEFDEDGLNLSAGKTYRVDGVALNPPNVPNLVDIDLLTFKTSPTLPAAAEGQTFYDATNKTLATRVNDGVTLQHGQEVHVNCHNGTGSTILDGKVVYVNGSDGTNPSIALANADDVATSDIKVIGVTTQNINDGADGKVTNFGLVHDLDTSAWTAGTVLYLSDSVNGALVSTAPASPSATIKIGIVTVQHATAGAVLVDLSFWGSIGDLMDVTIDTPLEDQILKYNGANWVNGQLYDQDLNTTDSPTFADVTITGLSGNIISSDSAETSIEEIDDSFYQTAMSGFGAWSSGTDADTYTITSGKLQIDRTGYGYIRGKKITWSSGQQTNAFSANTMNWCYIDTDGVLKSSTSFLTHKIILFEVLYDGTNYIVSKENHPVSFQTAISGYLHNNAGTTIRGIGAIATRVSTGDGSSNGDREIKIVGDDVLDDHGLSTTIHDSSGNGVSFMQWHINSSSKWIMNADQTQLQMKYNNAGTPTDLDAVNAYAVYTLNVAKDDIESGNACYCAVMDNAVYATLSNAQSAIANGNVTFATNELKSMEHAQLGYAIVAYSASGGYIAEIQVVKSTFNSQLVGGSSGNDHGLMTGLGDDDHTQYHNDTRALTWLENRSTDDLPDSTDKRYVTDAQQTVLTNTSNTNTGDQTKVQNLVGGNDTTQLGSIPYQSNTDTTTLLTPNTTTTKKFLRETGTGTNGTAPVWDTIAVGDVPVMTATVGGLVPTPPDNTTTFLRGDGTFASPASSGLTQQQVMAISSMRI